MQACILLVDDEPQLTEALRAALRREPFRILTAPSAAAALAVLDREPVDVVISDERMPGMGGTDLLAEVRRRSPDTIRMLLTGQSSLEVVVRAVNEGKITHFFSKPCAPAELAAVVGRALRLRALERDDARRGPEDATGREQASMLRRLELDHPGITDVRRDEHGAIVIPDDDDSS